MNRPVTTLFMLVSADGRISTGSNDSLDFDRDFPTIAGVREGLGQYYEIEQTTDLWSLNSGKVQQKMGVNQGPMPEKTPVNFVLVDNTHLTEHGIRHFCVKSDRFFLITSNPDHPAFNVKADNFTIIFQKSFCASKALEKLHSYGCDRLTIQTGGTLNGLWLREKLIDYVDFVIAPVLVGGKETTSVIDGPSLARREELYGLGVLKLESATVLEHSYVRLRYRVIS